MELFNRILASTLPAVPRPVVRRLSARYIAGESKDDALDTVRALNDQGMMATLDILGEFVSNRDEADRAAESYRDLLRSIDRAGLDSNVSIKLTQMGLALDPDIARELVRTVVGEAESLGNFVRLDMEDSSFTDATLDIHRDLRSKSSNVGCVIQAYLRRSEADVARLAGDRANVRLCKGIYIEPEEIAFRDHDEINRSFRSLLRTLLAGGCYTGIATHDESLVEYSFGLIDELGLDPAAYEFQMLLGVTEKLRARVLERGHRLRVYVPFGSHWYPYSVRRLKENPAIAGYALKGILGLE